MPIVGQIGQRLGAKMSVEFRFKLDERSDAALLSRIKERANGASENNAARFLLRYWFETERQNLPQLGQTSLPPLGRDDQDLEGQITDALASMDW